MNKNLKRTIALALAIGTVSAVSPATNVNLLTAKVYAAATDDNTKQDLDELQLESSKGNNIKIYSESDYDSDSKLAKKDSPSEDTYYAKTDYSKVNVKIGGPNKKYVKVFKSTSKSPSDSTKGKSVSDDINLSSGTNYITVRVYKDEPDSKIRYDDDFASEYVIKVKYSGNNSSSDSSSSSSSDDADDYDNIYLEKLTVDDGTNVKDIALSDSKVKYTYDVANNIKEVIVKAEPNDEDEDTIEINDDEVDDNDHYKKKISLNVGENKIKITTENEDDDDREYTLIINRAAATAATTVKAATATTGTATTVTATTAVKINQWVVVNGRDQYNDSLGHAVKNVWQAYGASWYYLGADGNMVTNSWKTSASGANWYYLGANGAMVTNCWVTTNGAYYYLKSDGSMATNTVINGYRVGANGAWIR